MVVKSFWINTNLLKIRYYTIRSVVFVADFECWCVCALHCSAFNLKCSRVVWFEILQLKLKRRMHKKKLRFFHGRPKRAFELLGSKIKHLFNESWSHM